MGRQKPSTPRNRESRGERNSRASMRKKVGINRRRRLTTARHNLYHCLKNRKRTCRQEHNRNRKLRGCGTRTPEETQSFHRSWEEGTHRAQTAKL
ncbi:unnamed protein product [Brassica rapa]|uniref:Uncharacterized protein n=2 Tax=Brassica TaxID=3705 RepID=A0A8D9CW72_BRACM|nr:unnamed protein product [Brassica napus]CAG7862268.1 unnamed protein product [Brassica rapa]